MTALRIGGRGTIVAIDVDQPERLGRLLALGITVGAPVRLLQSFPGVVFQCDQTELAVECAIANTILIVPAEE